MKTSLFLLLASSFFTLSAFAVDSPSPEIRSFRQLLGEMVHADTSQPAGNEARVVALVAKRLDAEAIPYDIVEFAPGRQCIVARLKGTGQEKPLLLLAHIDVVGTQNQAWETNPHTMLEKGGYLVGRGVGDDLGMAAMELEVLLALKKSATPLRRDVILALTGDEETGGLGIRYILAHRPELVNASIALNEGGGITLDDKGKVKLVGLQMAEKSYQDFLVSTKGTTGHSSVPLKDNAIYRLSRGLARLGDYRMPRNLVPITRLYFERRAAIEPPKLAAAMRAISRAKGPLPPDAVKEIEKDPALSANLRTTCVVTLIQGGTKENALPSDAHANINCRILPGESVALVQARLAKAIHDPEIELKPLEQYESPQTSPPDGEVAKAVERVTERFWPGTPVIPQISRGATDSRYLRMAGIAAYGIDPIAMTEADSRRAHGIDERIPTASLEPAFRYLHSIVLDLAAKSKPLSE